MTKFTEVIRPTRQGGTERGTRRTWSADDKSAILAAAFAQGGSVAKAAGQFGVSPPLIYLWRRQVRDGLMPDVILAEAGGPTIPGAAFSAAAAAPPAPPVTPVGSPSAGRACGAQPCAAGFIPPGRRGGVIEVRLANGRALKADESIAPDVLARLVAALDDEARLWQDGGEL
jgi:transposase